MPRFELDKLLKYDDASVLAEVRRVVALLPAGRITLPDFDRLSKVHSTTWRNRFGGWKEALVAAGVGDRYNDSNNKRTREEVVQELKRVAALIGRPTIGWREFEQHSRFKSKAVSTAFGSVAAAFKAAGLAPLARRDRSEEECFENILALWSHYGRAPKYGELNEPPSQVSGKVYARRWGGWRAALGAFLERVNDDQARPASSPLLVSDVSAPASPPQPIGPRDVPWRLRFRVFERDHFACVACGDSPATSFGKCKLHADHIVPFSKGGPTVFENLRTLCMRCNIGKGDMTDEGREAG
jgi:HNH endonuclease/Homing endonuclease associated repeat